MMKTKVETFQSGSFFLNIYLLFKIFYVAEVMNVLYKYILNQLGNGWVLPFSKFLISTVGMYIGLLRAPLTWDNITDEEKAKHFTKIFLFEYSILVFKNFRNEL